MSTRKYKVFMRVVGTVSIDASADSPIEAAEKVLSTIHEEREPKFLNIDIDDLETYIPVSYNDENGDTKDLDVQKDLVEQEVRNALFGSKLYALVRIERDEDGRRHRPEVKLFMNEKRAYSKMAEEYDTELAKMRDIAHMCSERPEGFFPHAYVKACNYVSFRASDWYIVESELNTGG